MIVTTIIASALIAQVGGTDSPKGLEELEHALQGYVKLENVSVFMDVEESMRIPDVPKKRDGGWSMVYLAGFVDREWSEIEGVQVFGRRARNQPTIYQEAQLDVLRIMNSLSDSDLHDALNDGMSLGRLPVRDVAELLGITFNWKGVIQSTFNSHPRETFDAIKGDLAQTSMRLMPMEKYVIYDDSGRKREVYNNENLVLLSMDIGAYVAPEMTRNQSVALAVAPAPVDGELNFGEGEIVSVRELLSQSSKVFKTRFRIDPRLYDNYIFVSGSYTKERFETCMDRIMNIEPFHAVTESIQLLDLLDKLASRLHALDESLYENRGSRILLQELEKISPVAYQQLLKLGMDPSSAQLQVQSGFYLFINPNSKIHIGTSERMFDGKRLSTKQYQKLGVGIGF